MESNNRKKLLFYGGAFDPPHRGHERLFQAAVQQLCPDLALVIPTGVSPHKARSQTPFWHRVQMSHCFLSAGDQVEISRMEGKGGRSYTFKTIKRLQKRYPGYRLYLLIGSDMLESFESWRLYRRILSRVTLVAGCRDDEEEADFLAAAQRLRRQGADILLLRFTPVEVSSTELRKALQAGGDVSAYLSPSVQQHIQKHGLYGGKKA